MFVILDQPFKLFFFYKIAWKTAYHREAMQLKVYIKAA